MRKYFILLSFAFVFCCAPAQQFKGLDNIPMKTKKDYKQAEPTARDCAKYLLSHPITANDESEKNATSFLFVWMIGTPDYSFMVDENLVKYSRKNDAISVIYMAAMLKAVFDKPELAKDKAGLKLAAYGILAEYAAAPANKVTQTSDIKKLIDANKAGKLADLIGK